MGFVDLHSHVLPGLDDGSPDLSTSLTMLRGLEAVGFERVCATPHQKASQFMPSFEAIETAYSQTKAALSETGATLALSLAAENFWDHVFFERSRSGGFPRYDQGKVFLFEIPTEDVPTRFEDTLFNICTKGFFPVMAHPERYAPFWRDVDRLKQIGQTCALVVDLGALAGYHGWRFGRVAKRLVSERLVHAAASDAHSPQDVRAAAEGIAWIKKKLGPEAVTRLMEDNPRAILEGVLPET